MKSADYFYIGPRLTLAFALLIALILAGNAFVIWQFHMARIQTDSLIGANQQLIAVLQLQVGLLSFHQRLDNIARSGDAHLMTTEAEPLRRVLEEQARQTRTAIANLAPGTQVDPAFLPTLETIEVALPGQLEAINDLAKSGDWGTVQRRLDNELKPIETQTSVLVGSIQQQANGELTQANLKMGSMQRRILLIVPLTAISTFFIAAFFGWAITRRIAELRLEERVNERTRIARELHDTLLQSFHGLMFQFQAARNLLLRRPESAMQALDEALLATEQAIAEGRDAIRDLRPEPTAQRDLAELLTTAGQELAGAYASNEHCPGFRVIVEGKPRTLSPTLQDEIYRIAREMIRNAFHHAVANHIEVEIRYDEHQLRLRTRDDGKGIDLKTLEANGRPGHWGLEGIRERARRIGSRLEFWSEAGAGTEVQLGVPAAIAYEKHRDGPRFRLFQRGGKDGERSQRDSHPRRG
jgi:signal transduction histidine kinase